MIDAARRSRPPTGARAPHKRGPSVRRLPGGRHIAAPLALLAVLATGVGYGESLLGHAAHDSVIAATALHNSHAADPPESVPVAEFKTFALNALLIPLLDDGASPRWVDPFVTTAVSLAIDCGKVKVSVDGLPLVPTAPVPARAFTLRWSMDHCVILNGGTSLTGDVELLVFHDGDRYSASVQPIGLHVVSNAGDEVMRQRFSTSTPLTPWTSP